LWERPELLDSAGRLLYRAYSFALVQLLIESATARAPRPLHRQSLIHFKRSVGRFAAVFSALAGNDQKIWKSKIVDIKNSGRADLLTFPQTEERLASL